MAIHEQTKPAATTSMRTWQRRKHARPGEITKAALSAFAEKGYAETTMADIAAGAGITKGTIYLYYVNKEELFNALVRTHITEKLATKITPIEDGTGDVLIAINTCFDVIADVILTDEALALSKIITSEARTFPGLAQYWRTEVISPLLVHLTALMERGVREGMICGIKPEVAALLCLAPAMLSLVWRSAFDFGNDDLFTSNGVLDLQRAIIIQGLTIGAANPLSVTQPALA